MKKAYLHLTKSSISKLLLAISFLLVVGSGLAQIMGKVKDVGVFFELFCACAGLYFGRQLNISKDDTKIKEPEEL